MSLPTPPRRTGAALVAVLAATILSCSREPARPPLHPVQGSVTVRNKPAVKAFVVLRPVAAGPSKEALPRGEVGPDGTFRIGTYSDADGAPAGEYVVTITWPETRTDSKTGDEIIEDRLGGRYADPAKSSLKVTVQAGSNDLPTFRLE